MPNQHSMKKIIFGLLLFLGSFSVFGQTVNQEINLFGQCMVDIDSPEEMKALETVMRTNPYIKVVRLDITSKRAFILTQNLDELSEENFISWFNEYSDNVRCIQIGRHGVDIVKPFPFEGCEK